MGPAQGQYAARSRQHGGQPQESHAQKRCTATRDEKFVCRTATRKRACRSSDANMQVMMFAESGVWRESSEGPAWLPVLAMTGRRAQRGDWRSGLD